MDGVGFPIPVQLVGQSDHRADDDEARALHLTGQFGQLLQLAAHNPLTELGALLYQRHRGVTGHTVGLQRILNAGGVGQPHVEHQSLAGAASADHSWAILPSLS